MKHSGQDFYVERENSPLHPLALLERSRVIWQMLCWAVKKSDAYPKGPMCTFHLCAFLGRSSQAALRHLYFVFQFESQSAVACRQVMRESPPHKFFANATPAKSHR